MGIPRFYRWLRNRYPQIRIDLTDSDRQVPQIDNLYLDFNGMVYRCLRDFQCFLKNKFDPLSIDEIYRRVLKYMMKIMEKVNPRSTLFIAFDGVAPRAKINQSRDRRFRAASEKQKFQILLQKLGIADNQNFQDNSISPGTKFLTDFCSFLKNEVEGLIKSEWKDLKIIFSGCTVPGEGQHKIMDFLRQSKKDKIFHQSTTHCIYSADADVILLSLSLDIPNVCLIRQDSMKHSFGFNATTNPRKYRDPQFQYVVIDMLKQYFAGEFSQCMTQLKMKDVQPIIDDFILLMAFVGNDFLPTQFCFSLKQSHMQQLFESYKGYLMETKSFINNHGIIDWNSTQKLLGIAKQFQAVMMAEKIRNRESLQNYRQEEEDRDEQGDEIKNFQVVDKKITRGQQYYYSSRFGIQDIRKDQKYTDIVKKYIQGLEFYARYYFLGLPSWTWFYPYHYTPLITDVFDYISHNKVDVRLEKGQPFDQFLALMFMLPEESFKLLPQQIEDILSNEQCPLRSPLDYYPNSFKLDKYETIGYHKRALIPFLDQKNVTSVYQTIDQTKFTQEERKRNTRQQTVLLRYLAGNVSETVLDLQKVEIIQKLKKMYKKKDSLNMRPVFPSLLIYGKYKIDRYGRIVTERKYHYEGSPLEMVFFNHFIGYIEEKIECDEEMKKQFQIAYEKVGIVGTCSAYFKVKRARLIRQVGRISFVKTSREVLVPDFALFKVPKCSFIPEIHQFDVKECFTKGQQVSILSSANFGHLGVIEQLGNKTAKVKIIRQCCTTVEKIQQNEQQFYTLDYISRDVQVSKQILLLILDEVLILPKTNKKDDSDIYPTGVNLGLNIINVKEGLVLPHYARCQMQYESTKNSHNIFQFVELSESCRILLQKYISKFGWIIQYFEKCISEKNFSFKRAIYARQLFKGQNINHQLYRQLLKMYEIGVPGYFYSIYSKVSGKNLGEIKYGKTGILNSVISIPYSQLISKKQGKMAPPAFRSQPEFHDIGDKVLVLKTLQTGFIIGIDDHNLFIQTPGEMVKVGFLDVFNSKWGYYLQKEGQKVWHMDISYYSPQHYTSAKSH